MDLGKDCGEINSGNWISIITDYQFFTKQTVAILQ